MISESCTQLQSPAIPEGTVVCSVSNSARAFFRTLTQEELGQSSSEEPVEAWTSASSYMLNDECVKDAVIYKKQHVCTQTQGQEEGNTLSHSIKTTDRRRGEN